MAPSFPTHPSIWSSWAPAAAAPPDRPHDDFEAARRPPASAAHGHAAAYIAYAAAAARGPPPPPPPLAPPPLHAGYDGYERQDDRRDAAYGPPVPSPPRYPSFDATPAASPMVHHDDAAAQGGRAWRGYSPQPQPQLPPQPMAARRTSPPHGLAHPGEVALSEAPSWREDLMQAGRPRAPQRHVSDTAAYATLRSAPPPGIAIHVGYADALSGLPSAPLPSTRAAAPYAHGPPLPAYAMHTRPIDIPAAPSPAASLPVLFEGETASSGGSYFSDRFLSGMARRSSYRWGGSLSSTSGIWASPVLAAAAPPRTDHSGAYLPQAAATGAYEPARGSAHGGGASQRAPASERPANPAVLAVVDEPAWIELERAVTATVRDLFDGLPDAPGDLPAELTYESSWPSGTPAAPPPRGAKEDGLLGSVPVLDLSLVGQLADSSASAGTAAPAAGHGGAASASPPPPSSSAADGAHADGDAAVKPPGRKPPPPGYVCNLCFSSGHWMKRCIYFKDRKHQLQEARRLALQRGETVLKGFQPLPFRPTMPTAGGGTDGGAGVTPSGLKLPTMPPVPPRKYLCRTCGMGGHWVHLCPKGVARHELLMDHGGVSNASSAPNSANEPPVCKYCRRRGHAIHACPSRQKRPQEFAM
ncbi:hypothetical protein CXG81DRAFT_20175 [Caulochytrium protostelioides]|uniref:CCHC-type domain-containing protein n=1 Tax=Caulochytrium protostelioides TaxID=1555241 RepID=A0A4P9X3Z7_9FUNG|nr:hypothetical protein CXG81DRAFT_20175 [Caulochytrium protostelioides]|eukprot:RKO99777.1 hypothetical protein CXG81DRAFT_20175 [Caulochytrium protostelioides]